jgi:hypothetical protein
MATANNPCNSHYITTPTKSRNSLWVIHNLLKRLFKSNQKGNIMTLKDMHDLPMHIKKDIGFWDVKPEQRPRLPVYH